MQLLDAVAALFARFLALLASFLGLITELLDLIRGFTGCLRCLVEVLLGLGRFLGQDTGRICRLPGGFFVVPDGRGQVIDGISSSVGTLCGLRGRAGDFAQCSVCRRASILKRLKSPFAALRHLVELGGDFVDGLEYDFQCCHVGPPIAL